MTKFTCENREFITFEKDGAIIVAEVLINAPRNNEEVETQAFNELEDSGEFSC
ncbi:hypothetical protein N9955_00540 [bacterium]|nr:hypothetical protein [bacterium]